MENILVGNKVRSKKVELLKSSAYNVVINGMNYTGNNPILEIDDSNGKNNVSVETDENILENVAISIEGDNITIWFKTDQIVSFSRFIIKINAEISSIKFGSTFKYKFELKRTPEFSCDISGSCKGEINIINMKTLVCNISGSSRANISGSVDALKLKCSGSSKVKGQDLLATDAQVETSGASLAGVNAEANLEVRASGTSTVTYKGNPRYLEKDVRAAAKLEKEN